MNSYLEWEMARWPKGLAHVHMHYFVYHGVNTFTEQCLHKQTTDSLSNHNIKKEAKSVTQ